MQAASNRFLTTKFCGDSLPQSNERQAGLVASRSRRRGGSLEPRPAVPQPQQDSSEKSIKPSNKS
jgi:hypothetical protein